MPIRRNCEIVSSVFDYAMEYGECMSLRALHNSTLISFFNHLKRFFFLSLSLECVWSWFNFLIIFCVKNYLPFSHNVVLHRRMLGEVKNSSIWRFTGVRVLLTVCIGKSKLLWSNHEIVIIFNSNFFARLHYLSAEITFKVKWWMNVRNLVDPTTNNATKYLRWQQLLWNVVYARWCFWVILV